MLRCSKADRGILIGSFASSKHISAYWTTYQHISSCRFHLRWSWRGERRLNVSLAREGTSSVCPRSESLAHEEASSIR